jgi:hypothetical protein
LPYSSNKPDPYHIFQNAKAIIQSPRTPPSKGPSWNLLPEAMLEPDIAADVELVVVSEAEELDPVSVALLEPARVDPIEIVVVIPSAVSVKEACPVAAEAR